MFPRLLLIYKNAKWINYDRIRERRSNGRCAIVRDFKFHFAAALISRSSPRIVNRQFFPYRSIFFVIIIEVEDPNY